MTASESPPPAWAPASAALALSIVAVLALALLFQPSYVTTDSVHMLDGAKHLLAGAGYSTSMIASEQHYAIGGVPVAQTVWPPGFSLAIAVLAAAGLSTVYAGFWVAAFAFGVTGLLVYACLRATRTEPWTAVIACACCLATVLSASFALAVLTEPLFIAATVAGLYCLIRATDDPQRSLRWLFAAGVAAAAAISVRYTGVLFAAAAGITALVTLWSRPWPNLVRGALCYAAAPAVVCSALVTRNVLLGVSTSGRSAAGEGSSLIDVVRNFRWALADLLGSERSLLLEGALLLGLVGVVGVAGVVALRRAEASDRPLRTLLFGCACYAAVTVSALVVLGTTQSAGFMDARYLLPLLPFCVLAAAASLPRFALTLRDGPRLGLRAAVATLLVAFVAGQIVIAQAEVDWYRSDLRFRTVEAALAMPLGADTVATFLQARSSNEHPLLDSDGQYLAYLLDRPVIGLAGVLDSRRQWTAEEVRKLIGQYDVRYITLFPSLVSNAAATQQNRVFYQDLLEGRVPLWLTPEVDVGVMRIYSVAIDQSSDSN